LSFYTFKHQVVKHLLENLSVSPLVGLAVNGDWLIPTPLVFDESLVLGLGWVELGELVALVIGGDIEGWKGFLATNDESTLYDGVIGDSVNRCCAKEVFAASLETVEKSTCEMLVMLEMIFAQNNIPIKLEVMKVMVNSSLYL
jgi:hypothetical protein